MKFCAALLLAVLPLAAQSPTPAPANPGPASGGSTSGGGSPGTSAITRSPSPSSGYGSGPHSASPFDAQPIFLDLALSGRVLLEDNAPPPEPVAVSLHCVGPRPFTQPAADRATLTDTRGRFSLIVGLNNTPGTPNTTGGFSLPRLQGCAVLILLPGYTEYRKDLARLTSLSDFDLRDIRLLRLASSGPGSTLSRTSAAAPPQARREYSLAIQDAYSFNDTSALQHLSSAIALYPQYAAAHNLTAYLHDRHAQRRLARESYLKAAAADPLYLSPLIPLAQMAAEDHNFSDAARFATRAIELMPGAYPELYLIAAGAHFNLAHFSESESISRDAIARGLNQSQPRLHLLLAETLSQLKHYDEARQQFLLFAAASKDETEAADARHKAALAANLAPRN